MKALKITLVGLVAGLLLVTPLPGQNPRTASDPSHPGSELQLHSPTQIQRSGSATARFLTSEQGRAWFEAAGHPISKYLNQAFGPPSAASVDAARRHLRQMPTAQPAGLADAAAPTTCNGDFGARFNLEPRANAVPQQSAAADFILNGVGAGQDLIVQTANDARGNLTAKNWDDSQTGYYVHRAASSDCSVQFEGGLPNFEGTMGVGDASVVADPVRGAFFMADVRFGSFGGVGLFRASASDLMNPAVCPNGTHLEKQAESCWMQTPPVLIDRISPQDYGAELSLAVDERASNAGKGAGDLYLVANAIVNGAADTVFIVACTNSTLRCSPVTTINSPPNGAMPYAQVRSDGLVTISYLGAPEQTPTPEPILFVTCKPAGAPKPPVCRQPTTVTAIINPLPTDTNDVLINPLQGINLLVLTSFPKLANRKEPDGSFTTFLVYDACKDPYSPQPPPQNQPTICLNAEVNLTFSTDNGSTWSTPISVDKTSGHHFYPAISTDQSTGTTNIVYYTTEGDKFHHDVRMFLNQIAPGTTTLSPPQQITKNLAPMDIDPNEIALDLDDLRIGAIARGTGIAGQSHLYTSFGLSAVNGIYGGKPVPDKNNHISLSTF